MGRRQTLLRMAIVAFVVLASAASPALADHGRPGAAGIAKPVEVRVAGRFLGIVPSAPAGGRRSGRPTPSEFASAAAIPGDGLFYWGGPVMSTSTTYAVYWLGPSGSVSSAYESTISGFFQNLAAAPGASSDVYAVDTQYYGPTNAGIANQSTFGGSWVDTTNSIPDNCSAEYAGTGVTVSGCVLDTDIQAEVDRAIAANHWTPGPTSLFFVFTPEQVGSCFDSSSGQCAYTNYCAYHSNYTDGSGNEVLYANQPYSQLPTAPGACDSGEYPNGDAAADSTINLVSHEHNETITDPLGSAWYDVSGNEIGDKCAWNFGSANFPATGGASSQYNQTIGSGHYYLQQEWSNASDGCALSYGASGPPAISGFAPPSGAPGTPVTVSGSNLNGALAVTFNGTSAKFTVNPDGSVRATVPSTATSGPVAIRTGKGTATSSGSFSVLAPPPTVTGFSPSRARTGTSVTVSGTHLTGVTGVAFNGVPASFTPRSSTQLLATVPSAASSGPISVTTTGAPVLSTARFLVLPAITSFTPSSGPAGTPVTIKGSGFIGATRVTFNGVSANFTISSANQISATVPRGAGSGRITVTTPAGSFTSQTSFSRVR